MVGPQREGKVVGSRVREAGVACEADTVETCGPLWKLQLLLNVVWETIRGSGGERDDLHFNIITWATVLNINHRGTKNRS